MREMAAGWKVRLPVRYLPQIFPAQILDAGTLLGLVHR